MTFEDYVSTIYNQGKTFSVSTEAWNETHSIQTISNDGIVTHWKIQGNTVWCMDEDEANAAKASS